MKKILLLTAMPILTLVIHTQAQGRTDVKDAHDRYANQELAYAASNLLPEGAELKNGKVVLKRGYETSYADNNQVLIIKKAKAGGTTGAFSCDCERGSGGCTVGITDGAINCYSKSGCTDCRISVSIDPKNTAITKAGTNWKKLTLTAPKTEDPDQGGEIIRKKALPVKQ
ncbi:hypothetical protein [Niabella sp.]|uniref:hypothetical protein n=1 Tax=Niabella sp. TaxID=1962976 RepID=UPI00260D9FF4|nr:hypothetical protein [Niabella sp.]